MRNELLGLPVRRTLVQNAFPSLKIKPERTFAMANERSQRMQLKEQKEVQKRCLENAMQFAESTSSAASSGERIEPLPTELNPEPDYRQLYHELQQRCIKVEKQN
ncbi:uncharacterized protein LOC118181784 [Stegodyphus dumicola]|uniref:uncharacterized protein LOC118181784 n=1 Tax=Stegodyphus dumicola TaxID=202533 RepID=UPI0015AABF51|nr:uncharacterized protein LOC118181784 [Stegodyphus dumicola]